MVRLDLSGAGTVRVGAVAADERIGGGDRLGADNLGFFVLRIGVSLLRDGVPVGLLRDGIVKFARVGIPTFESVVRSLWLGAGELRSGLGERKR